MLINIVCRCQVNSPFSLLSVSVWICISLSVINWASSTAMAVGKISGDRLSRKPVVPEIHFHFIQPFLFFIVHLDTLSLPFTASFRNPSVSFMFGKG